MGALGVGPEVDPVITLDTSAILALVDESDLHHEAAVEEFEADTGPYIVPVGLLAEATYMLERRIGPRALEAFLADIDAGGLSLDCGDDDVARWRELVQRYADLPLGFADAAVVACAERHRRRVLSFDHHFTVVAAEGTIEVRPAG